MAVPSEVRIRMYNVGFGDCFLLTFRYQSGSTKERHVLIDFGSTAAQLRHKITANAVAADIEKTTGGRLDAVVATHRHQDHISGFDPGNGKGSGAVIKRVAANALIVQPWTEEPDLATTATAPAKWSAAGSGLRLAALRAKSLDDMNAVAEAVVKRAKALDVGQMDAEMAAPTFIAQNAVQQTAAPPGDAPATEGQAFLSQLGIGNQLRARLAFLGETNLKNLDAVKNLNSMSKRHEYLSYGAKTALGGKVLPGVKVHVLGPPTVKQHQEILNLREKDASEFWHLQAAAAQVSAKTRSAKLFPKAPTVANLPKPVRWFVRKLRAVQAGQLLELVRTVDNALNNTSLILLFEVGKKLLLFPGDAQIENWEYVLRFAKDKKKRLTQLSSVNLYKVGHHGSLNATPKTLWTGFKRKPALITMMSTRPGKHGHVKDHTEVPRATLVDALEKESQLHATTELKGSDKQALFEEVVVKV